MSCDEIVIWNKCQNDPDGEFGIILPSGFIKLPPSIGENNCEIIRNIIATRWADNNIISKTTTREYNAYIDLTDHKPRINISHETDDSFTVILPKRLQQADSNAIDDWVYTTFKNVNGWF